MSKLLSRKFLICLLAIGLTFSLVLLDKLETSEFMTILIGIVGIYTTGNVANKLVVR